MSQVFISYRREDAGGYAGWLRDGLAKRLGSESVFMDIGSIPIGVDFHKRIEQAISGTDVFIALIGKQWLTASAADGTPRLREPDDLVRIEIASALRRNMWVVPVLLPGATMPARDQLPPDIAPLAGLNGLAMTDADWEYDLGKLIAAIGPRQPVARAPGAHPPPIRAQSHMPGVIGLIVVVLILGGMGFGVYSALQHLAGGLGPGVLPPSPVITLSQNSAPVGAKVTVQGSGFRAGHSIDIYLHTTFIQSTTAGSDGRFTTVIQVPSNATPPGFSTFIRADDRASADSADAPFSVAG